MKVSQLIAAAALAAAAFSPNALADGREPGSVLVYPVHRSGGDPMAYFTILTVTNTNTNPATPVSFGGGTNVHFEYVNVTPNPANAFMPLACTIFDRIEYLTPADTLCVLTSCHNAFGGTGQEGYVVVSAEDPAAPPGAAWNHDFLIGSELVMSASGMAYMLNAIPLRGAGAEGARVGGGPGPLRFDGQAYETLPDVLMSDFLAASNSNLALINLTGGPNAENSLYFSVWNDNERALSTTLRFKCWFDQPLVNVSPLFSNNFLRSTPNDPSELDINCDGIGDIETGWFTVDSQGVFLPGGQPIAADGALLGSITASANSIHGGHILWQSGRQGNGEFRTP